MLSPSTKDLLSGTLALPAKERARVARRLLASLDETREPQAAEAWLSELERRSREVDEGIADLRSWQAVRASILVRWRRKRR